MVDEPQPHDDGAAPATPAAPASPWKRWLKRLALLALAGLALAFASPWLLRGPVDAPAITGGSGVSAPPSESIRVISLNLAHGRGPSFHQAFLSEAELREELKAFVGLLQEHRPDITCLQEADGPSWWSGGFDHVAWVAGELGSVSWARSSQVRAFGLDYGTGLLARGRILEARQRGFPLSPPTTPKGYTRAQVELGGRTLTVASLHLDFASASRRAAQVEALVADLREAPRPLIVAGDFNSDWSEVEVLPRVCEALGLSAYEPERVEGLETFSTLGGRLDWILISEELEFERYEVLPEEVSDHRAVLARLRWARLQAEPR